MIKVPIFRLSFLLSILFPLASSCFSVCCVFAGKNENELTLPEQGDKIFDSPDCSVSFGRLVSFSIFTSLFVVQYDVWCLQLIP